MIRLKLSLLAMFATLFSFVSFAQNSSVIADDAKYKKTKSEIKNKLKANKLPAHKKVTHQHNWGIGLRFGDPTAITAKKYLAKGMAVEATFGVTRIFQKDAYYTKRYNNWYNNKNFTYTDNQYLSYLSSTPIGLQVNYVFHKPLLSSKVSGLSWYFGAGAMVVYRNYQYSYRYKLDNFSDWEYQIGAKNTEVDFGVSGVIGIEYMMEKVPVSFFIDTALFMELFNEPFAFNGNGGLGARYNF